MVNTYFEHYGKTEGVGQDKTTYGKTATRTGNVNEATTYGETNTKTGSVNEGTTYGSTLTKGGSESSATTYGSVNTQTGGVQHTTAHGMTVTTTGGSESHDYGYEDVKNISRGLPMSSTPITSGSYGTDDSSTGEVSVSGITGLSWNDASEQNENTSQSASGFKGTDSNTTTYSGTDTDTDTYQNTTDSKTGTDTTVRSFTDRVDAKGGTDNKVTTYNNVIERKGGSDGKVTTYNNILDTNSGNDTIDKTNTKEDKGWHAGRVKMTPQEGLQTAMSYLMGTSPAFEWFKNKLEPAFMGIFDM